MEDVNEGNVCCVSAIHKKNLILIILIIVQARQIEAVRRTDIMSECHSRLRV